MMNHNPTLSREVGELRGIVLRSLLLFIFLTLLFLVGSPSVATRALLVAKAQFVPEGVALVALGPFASFVAPISFALTFALCVALVWLSTTLLMYILPALYPSERREAVGLAFATFLLFILGGAFGLLVLIPSTFSILYAFAEPIGVAPLFSLDAFVGTILGLTLATGFAFLLPVLMTLLSLVGLVSPRAWREQWRVATLLAILASAILTPDGSGVTMVLLAFPLLLLYGVGVLASAYRVRGVSRALLSS